MTEQLNIPPSSLQEDEISLLDLLLVVVENLRLLLLGPLLAGLMAYAISFVLPPTFESLAIVKGTQQIASLLTTAQVLDPVIDKLQLKKSSESLDLARQRLKKKEIEASFNAKDSLVLSYADVFAGQVDALMDEGDLLVAVSGSGNSPNVIKAIESARRAGGKVLGVVGYDGGKMMPLCDHCVWVPSFDMQLCEDVHLMFGHMVMKTLCGSAIK